MSAAAPSGFPVPPLRPKTLGRCEPQPIRKAYDRLVGKWLTEWFKRHRLTPEKLARSLHCNDSLVERKLRGEVGFSKSDELMLPAHVRSQFQLEFAAWTAGLQVVNAEE